MAKEDNGGATAPKSKLDLAKEAQAEVQEALNEKRIDFLESLGEFKSIGGVDNIEDAVLTIAKHFNGGVSLAFLQTVSSEAVLTKALKNLSDDGKIKRSGKKGNHIIQLVEKK